MESNEKALVLLSGGQDSATCLAWALAHFASVETVGFEYGQRHAVEMECRARIRERMVALDPAWPGRLGPDHLLAIPVLGELSDTALTRDAAIALREDGLPNTFVPGRNLLFFVLAAALGARRGARHLVGGMCETDYSGYPDCRDDTIRALETAIGLGMGSGYALDTPLMRLDKADTWRLAEELGGAPLVELIRTGTHTCYLGERGALHEWGYGCGECPACELRRAGYERYRAG